MMINHKARRDLLPLSLFFLIMIVSCKSDSKTISPVFGTFLNTILTDSISFISVDSLSALNNENHILLDAREENEFLVSHIPGARHIGYNEFKKGSLPDADKNQMIILYCSVGYRSEKIGEKLKEAGYTNVWNLYGGIFEWVNRGGELINESGKTNLIHPYSKIWGVWLKKGKKAYSVEEKSVNEDMNW